MVAKIFLKGNSFHINSKSNKTISYWVSGHLSDLSVDSCDLVLKVTTTHNLEMYKIQQKVQFKNKHIQCSHDSKLHYEVNSSTIHNHLLKTDNSLKPRL